MLGQPPPAVRSSKARPALLDPCHSLKRAEKNGNAIPFQPRSGARIKPTAQAVGEHRSEGRAPAGRKRNYDTACARTAEPPGRLLNNVTPEKSDAPQ